MQHFKRTKRLSDPLLALLQVLILLVIRHVVHIQSHVHHDMTSQFLRHRSFPLVLFLRWTSQTERRSRSFVTFTLFILFHNSNKVGIPFVYL